MGSNWIKLGLLISKNPYVSWLSGGSGPCCAVHNKNDKSIIDLYISGRDSNNRSLIGLAQYSIKLKKIVKIYKKPVLSLGIKGAFDENGTSYPSVIRVGSKLMMYYTGWIKGVHVPWYNNLGLALQDGLNFKRVSRAPIMPLTDLDPIGIGSSFVLKENDIYHLWYTRFERWGSENDPHLHYYNIKHAVSYDGVSWVSDPGICIDFQKSSEYSIAKPCVLKINNQYIMWYTFRGSSYAPGLAKSRDGITWTRIDDKVGISISDQGFDSEMLCYPYVIKLEKSFLMFYCGNKYGVDGLGLAEISNEKLMEMIDE